MEIEKNAIKELDQAKKELEKTQKKLVKDEETVKEAEKKVDFLKEFFVKELKEYANEIMKDWYKHRSAPKAVIRQKQMYYLIRGITSGRWGYSYYLAFSIEKDDKHFYNLQKDPVIVITDDGNLKLIEKGLLEGEVMIVLDDRFCVSEIGDEPVTVEEIIPYIYAFFYRSCNDYDSAIKSTKTFLETEYEIKNVSEMEDEIMTLLFKKHLDAQK